MGEQSGQILHQITNNSILIIKIFVQMGGFQSKKNHFFSSSASIQSQFNSIEAEMALFTVSGKPNNTYPAQPTQP